MRIDVQRVSPAARQAMMGLQGYVNACGLERSLLLLVQLRASEINGCAFCIAMHATEARAADERQERLDLLSAWREADIFTAREQAALAWTEAVTLVATDHVPDAVYNEARQHFSEKELTDLTMAIIAINGWNRLNVAFRRPPAIARKTLAA